MAFLTLRYAASFLGRRYADHGPDLRLVPDVVVLPVREGYRPSGHPPVRIFAGTEAAQFRAERIFIWSIGRVRDPARVYEIHLMKDLAGFDRRLWLTGFTNYRFAVPHLAGAQGRAIYNDVDQIYLADPGLLFDIEMDGHGYRSISDRDTSVMLIDCARMAAVWRLDDAMRRPRRVLDADARGLPGLWGPIDRGWNARDSEYDPHQSKLLHFTALQTQPWRPMPGEYVYTDNPVGEVWFDLERSADQSGFTVFNAAEASQRFRALAARLNAARGLRKNVAQAGRMDKDEAHRLGAALERHGLRDAVYFNLLNEPPPRLEIPAELHALDPGARATPAGAVLAFSGFEMVPDDDVPWMLDWLFDNARRLVFLRLDDRSRTVRLPDGGALPYAARGAEWWGAQLEAASARRPGLHWIAAFRGGGLLTPHRIWFEGGARLDENPRTWVLASEKTGHTSQAIGVAEALGWPYMIKRVGLNLATLLSVFAGRPLPRSGPAVFMPPWPDLVIASGWLPTRAARRIREQSGGRAAIVLLGRKAGALHDPSDIVVSCRHFGLPAHPRRIQTTLPPCQVTSARLAESAARWPDLMVGAREPRVVLLVGGSTKAHRFDPDFARQLGYAVSEAVERIGGALFVVTSRRTGAEATKALRRALPVAAHLHAWSKDAVENPFLGYLAQADLFVVTGESESMLAEAVATGKPVYIFPVPSQPAGPWQRLSAWIAGRGNTRPENYRGTARPQQGLEYLCARLIDRGIVLPPRDLAALHWELVQRGLARMFTSDLDPFSPAAHDATAEAAQGVRRLLGVRPAPPAEPPLGETTGAPIIRLHATGS